MGNLTFDNTTLSSFGVVVSGEKSFNAPERDVESIEIAGRNGDLIIDNGRYRNRRLVYPAFIYKNTTTNVASLRSFLSSHSAGYYRLTDSYDTEHFIMARYSGNVEFEMHNLNRFAHANLTFGCKPQRFLESGETPLVFEEYGLQDIENPTMFEALPLLRVYGSGWIRFTSGSIITISETGNQYIDIDCESMQCYEGEENRNANVTVKNGFPVLLPGVTSFLRQLSVTRVEVIPRWWEL